jgi:glycosyltransferase involved in cell wall biosynthesis
VLKYRTGWDRRLHAASLLARQYAKQTQGALRQWPVYRPPIDHAVYDFDNEALPSTYPSRARIVHRMSWSGVLDRPAVIEFEHPFALVGHLDARTSYRDFARDLPSRLGTFIESFDPQKHRLLGTSQLAVSAAHELLQAFGLNVASDSIEVLRWGGLPRLPAVRTPRARLRVFHYGGAFPFAKGTHDVIAVAARLPHVEFEICVNLAHPLAQATRLRNVHFHPLESKAAYDAAIDRSHVLLNPLYADGWGAILDALARSMPLVTYDSYDKAEAVRHGTSGVLVHLPPHLSFYASVLAGEYDTWDDYNAYVAAHRDPVRVDALAAAIEAYEADIDLLRFHSREAACLYREQHDGPARIARLRTIYNEIAGFGSAHA